MLSAEIFTQHAKYTNYEHKTYTFDTLINIDNNKKR